MEGSSEAQAPTPQSGGGDASVQRVDFGEFGDAATSGADNPASIDRLLDVQIPVSVEVGTSRMPIEKILDLVPGSIVCLDKKAEEPVDLRVNGKLVARGEVVLVDDTYGLRITQIIDAMGRIESIRAE